MADQDWPEAPSAPKAKVSPVSEVPTIRDHAERLQLDPWQVGAVVARMNGEHDDKGVRKFPQGVSVTTRIGETEFDAALHIALHGRV